MTVLPTPVLARKHHELAGQQAGQDGGVEPVKPSLIPVVGRLR
jgi:hypothetical protein